MPKRRRKQSMVHSEFAKTGAALVMLALLFAAYHFGLIAMVLDPVFAIFKPE